MIEFDVDNLKVIHFWSQTMVSRWDEQNISFFKTAHFLNAHGLRDRIGSGAGHGVTMFPLVLLVWVRPCTLGKVQGFQVIPFPHATGTGVAGFEALALLLLDLCALRRGLLGLGFRTGLQRSAEGFCDITAGASCQDTKKTFVWGNSN